jgi:hypothetical protein
MRSHRDLIVKLAVSPLSLLSRFVSAKIVSKSALSLANTASRLGALSSCFSQESSPLRRLIESDVAIAYGGACADRLVDDAAAT